MIKNMTQIRRAAIDPIGNLVEANHKLNSLTGESFAHKWIVRAISNELTRYTMEDDYIDLGSEEVRAAFDALARLENHPDWLSPELVSLLRACRAVAKLPEIPTESKTIQIEVDGRVIGIQERTTDSILPFQVSSRGARSVAIIEESLGDPKLCNGLIDAFSRKIKRFRTDYGVTHLAFIEKEVGPVGTLSMFSSLVGSTGLPACIFRETHWAERSVLIGSKPQADAKIVLLYDMIVTGAGIKDAADSILRLTGARSVGALFLCGYGNQFSEVVTASEQRLKIEALVWRPIEESPIVTIASREESAAWKSSEPATSREAQMQREDKSRPPSIQPGSYTYETLPPLSKRAQELLTELEDEVGPLNVPGSTIGVTKAGLRLTHKSRPIALHPTDKSKPIGLNLGRRSR